jgi:hypothetical protein
MTEHLGDLELDALRLDPAALAPERAAHLAGCARCAARRDALEADAKTFVARFEPTALAADALARAEAQRHAPNTGLGAALARVLGTRSGEGDRPLGQRLALLAVFAASALVIVRVGGGAPREDGDPNRPSPSAEVVRAKGGDALVSLFVVDGERRRPLDAPIDGPSSLAARVTPGRDAHVRLAWRAGERWSALYPAAEDDDWRVSTDGAWLGQVITLDGAPGPESLGVVACDFPVTWEEARAQLEADGGQRALGRRDCTVERLEIPKP